MLILYSRIAIHTAGGDKILKAHSALSESVLGGFPSFKDLASFDDDEMQVTLVNLDDSDEDEDVKMTGGSGSDSDENNDGEQEEDDDEEGDDDDEGSDSDDSVQIVVPAKRKRGKGKNKAAATPLVREITYTASIYTADQMKKSKSSRVAIATDILTLNSDEPFDTLKAQLGVKIVTALKPAKLDFDDYIISFTVPRQVSEPIGLTDDKKYKHLVDNALKVKVNPNGKIVIEVKAVRAIPFR
ncbi:hypothetical protein B0H16DRAFT_1484141 [Mycena metata]|uniref:Uncharacterized protein n=1 Tax=Mycena metata TaxID=1033252 RepID=A0AAD7GKL6_9AGAR|nr:hypothetical protein B0H16DRAFT_1484141 [Mycena metata]